MPRNNAKVDRRTCTRLEINLTTRKPELYTNAKIILQEYVFLDSHIYENCGQKQLILVRESWRVVKLISCQLVVNQSVPCHFYVHATVHDIQKLPGSRLKPKTSIYYILCELNNLLLESLMKRILFCSLNIVKGQYFSCQTYIRLIQQKNRCL